MWTIVPTFSGRDVTNGLGIGDLLISIKPVIITSLSHVAILKWSATDTTVPGLESGTSASLKTFIPVTTSILFKSLRKSLGRPISLA